MVDNLSHIHETLDLILNISQEEEKEEEGGNEEEEERSKIEPRKGLWNTWKRNN